MSSWESPYPSGNSTRSPEDLAFQRRGNGHSCAYRASYRKAIYRYLSTILLTQVDEDETGNKKEGLVVVDVVTGRKANLHDELLHRLAVGALPLNAELYAAAYRVVDREGQPFLDMWQEALAVGGSLLAMPLWLRGGLCLPVDLSATYIRTCQEQRIAVDSA